AEVQKHTRLCSGSPSARCVSPPPRSIQSEVSFEGASGNLKRLYDKAAKMYQQLKKGEGRKLSPSKKRCKDIKRLLVSFMYLQSLLQPRSR
ncbi:hypothetical protein ASZ78_007999, partial [Callipepla squamata]